MTRRHKFTGVKNGSRQHKGSRPRISIAFDEDVFEALVEVADSVDASVSSTVNDVVRAELKAYGLLN